MAWAAGRGRRAPTHCSAGSWPAACRLHPWVCGLMLCFTVHLPCRCWPAPTPTSRSPRVRACSDGQRDGGSRAGPCLHAGRQPRSAGGGRRHGRQRVGCVRVTWGRGRARPLLHSTASAPPAACSCQLPLPTHSMLRLRLPAVVNKTAAGAFSSQQFRDALQASGAKTVIVMGVETDYCVLSTVLASVDAVRGCCERRHVLRRRSACRAGETAPLPGPQRKRSPRHQTCPRPLPLLLWSGNPHDCG